MTYQQMEQLGRAASVDDMAFRIERYVDKAAAERYRQECRDWIKTGISPYLWDNAMPLVRECEEAE